MSQEMDRRKRSTSVTLFKEDDAFINRIVAKGLTYDVHLKVSQVLRLLFRLVDPEKISEADFRAARERPQPPRKKR
jgi:hypothetical protein